LDTEQSLRLWERFGWSVHLHAGIIFLGRLSTLAKVASSVIRSFRTVCAVYQCCMYCAWKNCDSMLNSVTVKLLITVAVSLSKLTKYNINMKVVGMLIYIQSQSVY